MTDAPAMHIKLLLADVDGTLVTKEKILTARAKAAVRALGTRGIAFAITSGRPPRGMAMLIEPLALTTPIAGFNGGAFVNPDLTPIEGRTLAEDVARRSIEAIGQHTMDAWLYTDKDWLVHRKDAPHVAREEWTVKFPPTIVDEFPADALSHAVKIVGVSDDLERVAACEKDLQTELGDRASAARSQPYYLDVTHPQANKGAVVDFLSVRLGIPAAHIATIGDMPNDVLMFRRSGFSIAMGNAAKDVQAQASATTADSENEGFAAAVERYLLGA